VSAADSNYIYPPHNFLQIKFLHLKAPIFVRTCTEYSASFLPVSLSMVQCVVLLQGKAIDVVERVEKRNVVAVGLSDRSIQKSDVAPVAFLTTDFVLRSV
jgi:hypothetical protein